MIDIVKFMICRFFQLLLSILLYRVFQKWTIKLEVRWWGEGFSNQNFCIIMWLSNCGSNVFTIFVFSPETLNAYKKKIIFKIRCFVVFFLFLILSRRWVYLYRSGLRFNDKNTKFSSFKDIHPSLNIFVVFDIKHSRINSTFP